jgi:hypothetical protein
MPTSNDLPFYRVVVAGPDADLEEDLNRLARDGYRILFFKEAAHWSEEDGHHGHITAVMGLTAAKKRRPR